jgi:hypothetical protein
MTVPRTGVRWHFSAAHRAAGSDVLHGHTWEVTAWASSSPGLDAVEFQGRLRALLAERFDHRTLPDGLARGEDIAAAIRDALECWAVEVARPAEGIFARVGGAV